MSLARSPFGDNRIYQAPRVAISTAFGTIGAYEVRVAESADCLVPILLASRPEIAAGETTEHRGSSGLHSLALEREEYFLYGVGGHVRIALNLRA
jgi:hypothetical protein